MKVLDEFESKRLLREWDVPCVAEHLVDDAAQAVTAAQSLGWPVVLKGCGAAFAHKTDLDLVQVGLATPDAVAAAAARMLSVMQGRGRLLVQCMVRGRRELLVGMSRDPQFGPVVSVGLGGIFTEALDDIAMRLAPLSHADACAMLSELRGARLLGPFRGEPPADGDRLARLLIAVGDFALARPNIREIDINPVILVGANPIAVDALLVLDDE